MKISFSVVVIDVLFVLRYNKTPTRTGRGLVCHFFEWFLFNYEKINQDNRGHYITDALPFLSHITTLLLDESYIAEIWILSNMGIIGSFIGFNQLARRTNKEEK